MNDLEWLVAIEQIKQLVARRIKALDARDWQTYVGCHASQHTSTAFKETGDRESMMAALLRETEGVSAIHHVHSPDIEILSETEAKGTWALEDRRYWKQGDEDHWLHGWGYYHETYTKHDGRWMINGRDLVRTRIEHSPGSNRASSASGHIA